MTGLDKIIKEIQDEAAAEARDIVAKAEADAKKLSEEAGKKRGGRSAKIKEDADREVKNIELSGRSAIELARKQRTLQTKQEIISETLQMALDKLYSLPDDEYFSLVCILAVKSAEAGKGSLHLNDKDLKRLPAGFEKELASRLPEGAELAISKETRPIDGGFVLQYGDIEENCSFSAIFDARRDDFSDLVQEELFA